jgi:CheY-like chemotaxis protein
VDPIPPASRRPEGTLEVDDLQAAAIEIRHQQCVAVGCRANLSREPGARNASQRHHIGPDPSSVDHVQRRRGRAGVLAYRPNIPRGAVFSIRLQAEAATAERPQARAASVRILLVDDHTGVREATAMLLRGEGFEVQSAASLAEANEALRENPRVHLVIADYHLQKGETGIEVIAAARQVAGEHLGAVLVSGDISSTLSNVEATERLRVASKPIRSNKLLALIRELLSAREDT